MMNYTTALENALIAALSHGDFVTTHDDGYRFCAVCNRGFGPNPHAFGPHNPDCALVAARKLVAPAWSAGEESSYEDLERRYEEWNNEQERRHWEMVDAESDRDF